MPIDEHLLARIVQGPDDAAVGDSAVVRTVALGQPENAVELVPYLDEGDTLRSRNARRILCRFDSDAVPFIAGVMNDASWRRRAESLEIIWSILSNERDFLVPEILAAIAPSLDIVFDDKTVIDEDLPEETEVDLRDRVCDLAFIVVKYLLDPDFDRSAFRSASEDVRDAEIRRLGRNRYRRSLV
jgi:hypothetical protein